MDYIVEVQIECPYCGEVFGSTHFQTDPYARDDCTEKTSPGSHSYSMAMGRQQTVQSSMVEPLPCEVSSVLAKTSPQYGHSICTSTM